MRLSTNKGAFRKILESVTKSGYLKIVQRGDPKSATECEEVPMTDEKDKTHLHIMDLDKLLKVSVMQICELSP